MEQNQLTVQVRTKTQQTACPICHAPTEKVHSRYQRTVADVSWGSYQVCLELLAKKFFCHNKNCKRRVFTERLPTIVPPWGRKTERLTTQLTKIGLAMGGLPGSRLTAHLGVKTSRQTLLRLVMKMPTPSYQVPKVLGVDDWAYRKSKTYGTILVDLEKHQPIDLLSDRKASTLAEWLEQNPGVEIISRDRAKAYKQGAEEGCPEAIQVADRFHLLENLSNPLEIVLNEHHQLLKKVEVIVNASTISAEEQIIANPVPPPPQTKATIEQADSHRNKRLEEYEQVHALNQQGWTKNAIARKLGISRRKVFRFLQAATFPERKGRSDRGRSLLAPYQKYLLEQWNNGRHNATKLWQEIQQQGYQGSYATVAGYARRLRDAQGLKTGEKKNNQPLPKVFEPKKSLFTVRRAVRLILSKPSEQNDSDTEAIALLKQQHPNLNLAIELAQSFANLVRQKQPEQLEDWYKRASSCQIKALESFAKSLKEDWAAVKNGVTLSWSNGQVEGQINRLKMLKRQMYGRASHELLKKRFLCNI